MKMDELKYDVKDDNLTIELSGHIDSNNATQLEESLMGLLDANEQCNVILDCQNLEYISSAGLRVVLKVNKKRTGMKVINVSSNVYEVFDMTGFTQMLDIHKAFRTISIEGCEVIGQGANGKVYRIDPETIVKVFTDEDALQDIERERQLAKTAFVLGVPTAISYDVVKIEGGGYGSVYELLKSTNLAKLILSGEKSLDEVVKMSVELLKLIHSKEVDPSSMPSMKERAIQWVEFLKEYLPEDQFKKLHALVSDIPENNHMLHGDFHLKNIMLQDDEALLIDMDTLCHGNPVFELASIYNAYCGFSDTDHRNVKSFLGLTYEMACEIWDKTLSYYLDTTDSAKLDQARDKAMLMGYTRLLRREIRRDGFNNETGLKVIESAKNHIAELLSKVKELAI